MRASRFVLVAAALSGACGRDPELKAPLTTLAGTTVGDTRAISSSCKPEPPVAVALTSRALGADRYALTAVATPRVSVDRLEITLVAPAGAVVQQDKGMFGVTAGGEARVVHAIVEARGVEVAASVRVPVDGIEMAKATSVWLGVRPPAAATRAYATPEGELVREVRR